MIKSSLAVAEFVLRGGRSHLFLLQSGSGRLVTETGEKRLQSPCFLWLPCGHPGQGLQRIAGDLRTMGSYANDEMRRDDVL